MIMLTYSDGEVIQACQSHPRFDQIFVDYLRENEILFVDGLHKHVEDFHSFNCSPEEYVQRYYIGHYNPAGNHFFVMTCTKLDAFFSRTSHKREYPLTAMV